jgi:D-alanine-D-alanine ligase
VTEVPGPGWTASLETPLFIKPNQGGSSLGMAKIENPGDLAPAVANIIKCGDSCLLEEFIPGQEITCGVLDEEPLPLILIRPKAAAFFDYESKYVPGAAEEICPAPIDEDLARSISEMSVKAHKVLGLSGYSRADFMVADGKPYLLEVNTLPGMTQTSLVPQAAAAAGYDFPTLIARLIELGILDARRRGQ